MKTSDFDIVCKELTEFYGNLDDVEILGIINEDFFKDQVIIILKEKEVEDCCPCIINLSVWNKVNGKWLYNPELGLSLTETQFGLLVGVGKDNHYDEPTVEYSITVSGEAR